MLTTVLDVFGLGCLVALFALLFGIAGALGATGVAVLVVSWRIQSAEAKRWAQRRAEMSV